MNAATRMTSSFAQVLRLASALFLCVPLVLLHRVHAQEADQSSKSIDFAKEIAPILVTNCMGCHDQKKRDGGYSLTNANDLFTTGDSGIAPIAPHETTSEILRRLRSDDEAQRMPAENPALPEESIALIEHWIAQGAEVNIPRDQPLAWLIKEPTFTPPEHYPRALPISAMSITPDGQTAIVSGYGELLFWNLSDSTLTSRLAVQGRRISDIDLSKDGHVLAVASGTPGSTGSVQFFTSNESTWLPQLSLSLSDAPIDLAISPNNQFTLVGTGSGSLIMLNNADGKELFKLDSHAAAVTAVAWSKDSSKFYSASRDRSAKSYKADNGEILGAFAEHERVVGGVGEAYNGAYTLEESGRLSSWIEGVQSHRLSQKHNFSPRVSKLLCVGYEILVLESDKLKVLHHISEQVPDGTDKEGKPKTKWTNRFEDTYELNAQGKKLLCFCVLSSDNEFKVFAGTADGNVLTWEPDQSKDVQATLLCRP